LLKTRVIAALVFTPAFIALVVLGGWALQLTCLVMVWLMLWEYLQLVLGPGEVLLKSFTYLLGTLLALYVMGLIPDAPLSLMLTGATLLVFIVGLVRPDPIESSTARLALAGLGVLYAAGLFPYLARLRELDQGLVLAATAVFCTWSADTGAYFAGRFLGRHKLYPKISPKKTIEGLAGGMAAAAAVALVIRVLFGAEWPVGHTVALGVVAAVIGTIGDLAASMVKRSVGAKDSGALIPGHGGVLDRFDGVIFVAPTLYLYVRVLLPK
jgi:phosphatidate cytidylyltransferase